MTKAQWYQLALGSIALIPAGVVLGNALQNELIPMAGVGLAIPLLGFFKLKGLQAGRREEFTAIEEAFEELPAKISLVLWQKEGSRPVCHTVGEDRLEAKAFADACDRAANRVPFRLKRRLRNANRTKLPKGLPLWFFVLEHYQLREPTHAEVMYPTMPQAPERTIENAARASVLACRKIRELI